MTQPTLKTSLSSVQPLYDIHITSLTLLFPVDKIPNSLSASENIS